MQQQHLQARVNRGPCYEMHETVACFLSVSTDMIDKIKKWKRRALSTQNDLIMKKSEINQSSSFCRINYARILLWMNGYGRTDR